MTAQATEQQASDTTRALRGEQYQVIIPEDIIPKHVGRLAAKTAADYGERNVDLLLLGTGGIFFGVDYARALSKRMGHDRLRVHVVKVASYGNGRHAPGTVRFETSLPDLSDRNVVVVDEFVDSGNTQYRVGRMFDHHSNRPASIAYAALMKREGHRSDLVVHYPAFELNTGAWIYGQGCDVGDGTHRTDLNVWAQTKDLKGNGPFYSIPDTTSPFATPR